MKEEEEEFFIRIFYQVYNNSSFYNYNIVHVDYCYEAFKV